MAPKHPKAWVLTTNRDFNPEKALQLGQLLTNPGDPNSAILAEGVIPVRPDSLQDISTHHDVDFQSRESHQTSFRAWLDVSAPVPAGVDGTVRFGKDAEAEYKSKSLSVHLFAPSDDYARECLAKGDAPTRTKLPWYKIWSKVYLVTGVRVMAEGTKITLNNTQSADLGAHAKVDANAANVPLSAGTEITHKSNKEASQTIGSSDAFIYAYRLHQIHVYRNVKKVTVEAYTGGEVYSTDHCDDHERDDVFECVGVDFEEVNEEPYQGDDLDDLEDDERQLLSRLLVE